MLTRLGSALLVIIACCQYGSSGAVAQTVTIQSNSQFGHGFIFRHGTQCYVIMPKHVAGGKRRVTVYSAAPVLHSGALVDTPFWAGIDLALGVVRGPVEDRCTRTLEYFDTAASPENGAAVQLLRLRQSGEIERVDMVVTKGDYLTLEARVNGSNAELFKGTSGAFLFVGDIPIGMVTKALSDKDGLFMRVEEIQMNIERRLNRRAGFVATTAPASRTQTSPKNSLPFVLKSVTLPPTFPDFGEENMQGQGSYVFDLTQPNRLAFKIVGDQAVSLSRVRILSNPDADYALPRGVRVDVSSQPDGSRTRSFLAGDMGPDGLFDSNRQPSLVRWVYITVTGGWQTGPIGIDQVIFE